MCELNRTRMQTKKTGRRQEVFHSQHHRSQNKDGEVKDEFPNMQYVETNEGKMELPEDEPTEDEGELMAERPEEVELYSMFANDEKPNTEAHAFVEFCMATKTILR